MRVLICNERFLFRFGVDRVLILLGKALKEQGHSVYLMGNRMDVEVVNSFAEKIIHVPTGNEFLKSNEYTCSWIEENWLKIFSSENEPDIIFVGGWPFFASVETFRSKCDNVVFLDCGAVPLDGLSGGDLINQQKVREMRKTYMKGFSHIIAISDFIANSQSRKDCNELVPIQSILLGADHMEQAVWNPNSVEMDKDRAFIDEIIEKKRRDHKIIVNLGRWEPNCYKNSNTAFDILRTIKLKYPKCLLVILADPSEIDVPADLKESVLPIGFPDDQELLSIMNLADIGISVSLWEGFNLPLAEMQWIKKQVLVFNVAAHPEVVIHPWYLCENIDELSKKACEILSDNGPDAETLNSAFKKFHDYFTWKRFINECIKVFIKLVYKKFNIIIDVTNSTKDPANSGVIRVTRRISRELQNYISPIFVIWDTEKKEYVLPIKEEYEQLGQYNGPQINSSKLISQSKSSRIYLRHILNELPGNFNWLLITETISVDNLINAKQFAKENQIGVSVIFYDAIPVLRPDLCNDEVNKNHANYMRYLAEADVVIPISEFSAQCLKKYWNELNIVGSKLIANILPGEFGGAERVKYIQTGKSDEISILCVSTLEPRKNHKNLIKACLQMEEKHPELNWSLTLVGNRYAGNNEIPEYVEEISKRNKRIKWLGIVDDSMLHSLYMKASFTVYPSEIEGYGMPIMESIWHGKPCICYNQGVMAELAASGGCITTNVKNISELSQSIYELAIDKKLYEKVSNEAISRYIKTWDDYVFSLLTILETNGDNFNAKSLFVSQIEECLDRELGDILYSNCLCENWQMNDSERLALIALLTKHKPKCSIEVGTFKGGSLSLISQYSDIVFSIDIDPTIPEKYKQFKNVVFLTGPSHQILPVLFEELDKAEIPVELMLIDGDHSAEGIRKDIFCLHSYIPKKPMIVVLHDSFNPECRRGMIEGQWEKSQYVHKVDLDFIPGRIVEHGGGGQGEMWGGLGLAYLKPVKRNENLIIEKSADTMHTILKDKFKK